MKLLPAIFLFIFVSGTAEASLVNINSSGSSDQNVINQALESVYRSGGGTVYLNPGVYDITGPIYMDSNTLLTGDSNAILRVSCPNGRWFSNSIGVINGNGVIKNVEICNFQIDGNCENLPFDYSHTRSDTAHDCEGLIRLCGDSTDFMNNIKIHDMTLYDAYSDGITILFCNSVECYNNLISNCEHEGIFYVCAIDSLIHDNKIAGITSDCLRLDNGVNCKIYGNILFSYNGSHALTYMHGENGLQIGDSGVSKGYDARNKPTTTTNIEVFNNTFANNGLQAILLDSVALASSANVYIHDNQFIGGAELRTMGIPVGDFNYTNMPPLEMSKKVFSNIFDILNMSFSDQAVSGGNSFMPDIKDIIKGQVSGGVDIVGFNNMVQIDGQNYIKSLDDAIISSNAENLASNPVSMDKETSLSRNGNNLTANLKINIKYDTVSMISSLINGKLVTKKSYTEHSETQEFSSSPVEMPNIYNGSAAPAVNVSIFNNSYNSQTRFYVPITPYITKISYEYNNSTSWHYLKVGEMLNTPKNVEYVSFKDVGYWDNANNTSYFGNLFVIPKALNPYTADQVKITLCDVYGNALNVTDYQIVDYNEDLIKAINPYAYLIFAFLLILFSGTLIIVKGVILRRR